MREPRAAVNLPVSLPSPETRSENRRAGDERRRRRGACGVGALGGGHWVGVPVGGGGEVGAPGGGACEKGTPKDSPAMLHAVHAGSVSVMEHRAQCVRKLCVNLCVKWCTHVSMILFTLVPCNPRRKGFGSKSRNLPSRMWSSRTRNQCEPRARPARTPRLCLSVSVCLSVCLSGAKW